MVGPRRLHGALLSILWLLLASVWAATAGVEGPASQGPVAGRRDGRDSYLDAYAVSHDGGFSDSGPGDGGGAGEMEEKYSGPPEAYGPPSGAYGPPDEAYGAPHSGPYSGGFYPAPQPAYGPPHPPPAYGPPHPPPAYGMPAFSHRDLGILGLKFATILKILLKFLVFKMIVKFIGVICLLLFLPKLSAAKDAGSGPDGGDSRGLSTHGSAAVDQLAASVWRQLGWAAQRYSDP